MTRTMSCSVDGCVAPVRCKGLCAPHYERWRKYADPLANKSEERRRRCRVDDCQERPIGRGYCETHYARWVASGDPLAIPGAAAAVGPVCSILGCEKKVHGRGWAKGPAWTNSPWHATSYRAVDEFEYIYLFHKPGPLRYDRGRLDGAEWGQWGSRGVWQVPSVAANNDHEARFPDEIPRRLIRLLSDPGDVILDPFAGSGTTLRVAADLGRRWIGFEIDPKWASTASHAAREASLRSLSA